MTDKPIILKNVRLSYPAIEKPAQPSYDEFAKAMLSTVASSLGIDYASLAADYRRQHEAAVAWEKAIYDAAVYRAVIYASIEFPLAFEIEILIGYNPQRLLPAPGAERLNLWSNKTLAEIARDVEFVSDFFNTMALDGECVIEFDSLYRTETILFVDSSGRIVDVTERRVPIEGRMTPFVRPVDSVILDLDPRGGEIAGILDMSSMLKKTMTVAPKFRRQPSYLDHDPTKRHTRYRK